MLKLLIADPSEVYLSALTTSLAGKFEIRTCRQGVEALELLRRFRPDLLVLELMLPELEGMAVLQQVMEEGIAPNTVVVTRFVSEYVQAALPRLGVSYLIAKPCRMDALCSRLEDIGRTVDRHAAEKPDHITLISNVLLELGFRSKLRGYGYLRDAIAMEMQAPNRMITKEIYPEIARRYNATALQVERSIRSAIGKAYEGGKRQVWERFFPGDGSGSGACPSNGEMICTLANRLRLSENWK